MIFAPPEGRRPNHRKKMLSVRQEKALRMTRNETTTSSTSTPPTISAATPGAIDIGREEGDARLRKNDERAEHRREPQDGEGYGADRLALQFTKLRTRKRKLRFRPAAAVGGEPFEELPDLGAVSLVASRPHA